MKNKQCFHNIFDSLDGVRPGMSIPLYEETRRKCRECGIVQEGMRNNFNKMEEFIPIDEWNTWMEDNA